MPGTPALLSSQPVKTEAGKRQPRGEPRLASGEEVPVDSPVHALQQELARIDAVALYGDSPEDKAPGWVRLTLPLASSIVLWAVILQFMSLIW